jgi:hypothetical protein
MAMLYLPIPGILNYCTVPSVRILFYYICFSFYKESRFYVVGCADSLPPSGALTVHPLAEGLLMNLITKRIIKLPSRPENHDNRVACALQDKEKVNGSNLHIADYINYIKKKFK